MSSLSDRPPGRPEQPWTHLGAVPSLKDIVDDPTLVGRLPRAAAIEYRRLIKRLDVDLEAHIAVSSHPQEIARTPEEADRAVGLDEAARILGIERRTLEKKPKWKALGGYKDIDGHIKFRLANLQQHLARRSAGMR